MAVTFIADHSTVRWLCITPLGSPVVPEVYMMNSRSSSAPAISGSLAGCAPVQARVVLREARPRVPPTCTQVRRSVLSPRRCSSATTGAKFSAYSSTVAPESFRMNSSSSATSRQFSGTFTAPILATAKKVSMNSAPFISSSATRSPCLTPDARSAWATRLQRALSSRKSMRRPPTAGSTMAST